MALPPEDRQRTDFGSDLPQDHALRAQVAEAERTFYTRDVDMVLFDSRGVHRGGIVASSDKAQLHRMIHESDKMVEKAISDLEALKDHDEVISDE